MLKSVNCELDWAASAVACRGKVHREGEVIHVVASHLPDLLRQVGQRDDDFHSANTRADDARLNGARDPRIPRTRDIPEPDLRASTASRSNRGIFVD